MDLWPLSDTGPAADTVSSRYCRRRHRFTTDGVVSSGGGNMADMLGATGEDPETSWQQNKHGQINVRKPSAAAPSASLHQCLHIKYYEYSSSRVL